MPESRAGQRTLLKVGQRSARSQATQQLQSVRFTAYSSRCQHRLRQLDLLLTPPNWLVMLTWGICNSASIPQVSLQGSSLTPVSCSRHEPKCLIITTSAYTNRSCRHTTLHTAPMPRSPPAIFRGGNAQHSSPTRIPLHGIATDGVLLLTHMGTEAGIVCQGHLQTRTTPGKGKKQQTYQNPCSSRGVTLLPVLEHSPQKATPSSTPTRVTLTAQDSGL
jgi:hypothetical protein